MEELAKWWKNKNFLVTLAIVFVALVLSYVMARFVSWGWVICLLIGLIGGYNIHKFVVKKLDEKYGGEE